MPGRRRDALPRAGPSRDALQPGARGLVIVWCVGEGDRADELEELFWW
jgi:hypothetical protein